MPCMSRTHILLRRTQWDIVSHMHDATVRTWTLGAGCVHPCSYTVQHTTGVGFQVGAHVRNY